MFELTFLVPLADNDGITFTPAHHDQFEATVVEVFGGFTRLGLVVGGWSDGKVIYHDTTMAYVVALKSITDGARVANIVAFAKAHFRQEAIYVRYLGLAEIL